MKQSLKPNENTKLSSSVCVFHCETHHICKNSDVHNTSALMKQFICLKQQANNLKSERLLDKFQPHFKLPINISDAINDLKQQLKF